MNGNKQRDEALTIDTASESLPRQVRAPCVQDAVTEPSIESAGTALVS
jgi:hypothetical protein